MNPRVADGDEPVATDPALAPNRWILLAVLTAALMVSFVDRTLLTLLVQPIKNELHLSDAAIGALTGFAFSACYAGFGLVAARVADRGFQRGVILVSLVSWSIMTALCGAAMQFWQLLLARFGVGAGEAGVVPAGQSILGAIFPPERRSTALAILMAGGPFGILLAFLITGPIESAVGWRMTFALLALPGLALALLAAAVRFPAQAARARAAGAGESMAQAFAALSRNRPYRAAVATIVGVSLVTFGLNQWLPAFLERGFAVDRHSVGPILALTQGLGMLIGTVAGGPLFDRITASGAGRRAWLVALACIVGVPMQLLTYVMPTPWSAAALSGVAALVLALPSGQLWALVQAPVAAAQRASAVALAMLAASFLGQGLGPFAVGWLSDMLAARAGDHSLGLALLAVGMLGGAWTIWSALRQAGLQQSKPF